MRWCERDFYLTAFVRMAMDLLPVGLLLIGSVFVRRHDPTRQTLVLQLAAGAWFVSAVAKHVALNPAVGLFRHPTNVILDAEGIAHLNLYATIASVLVYLELGLFILFAAAFVICFRVPPRGTEQPNNI